MKPDKDGFIKESWVNNKYDVMDQLTKISEWPVFKTKAVKDLIKFKWQSYTFNFHLVGFMNHMVLLALIVVYDINVYLNDNLYEWKDHPEPEKCEDPKECKLRVRIDEHGNDFAFILLIGVVYSFVYLLF